jgi:Uma2 family endonuclease
MESASAVSVEEYLHTSYDPDCDYVDDRVEERCVGERDHSELQLAVGAYFFTRRSAWKVRAFTEQRLAVAPRRYRIPDICVTTGERPDEKVFSTPPLICIEILSAEDRLARVLQRLDDYVGMGVANIWLLDPETRRAWTYSSSGLAEVKEGVLRVPETPIEVPLDGIFAALD